MSVAVLHSENKTYYTHVWLWDITVPTFVLHISGLNAFKFATNHEVLGYVLGYIQDLGYGCSVAITMVARHRQ